MRQCFGLQYCRIQCDHGQVTSLHRLDPALDRRLRKYAASSWNAYEATRSFQQFAALISVFEENLRNVFGNGGIGDARRAWGVAADLLAAMIGVAPSLAELRNAGFAKDDRVLHIITFGGDFGLATSSVMQSVDFAPATEGDLMSVLRKAERHHRVAQSLLVHFQEEIRAYDEDAPAGHAADGAPLPSLRDLMRLLPDVPADFPLWDGRPMFLQEQKLLLEYMARCIGCEIIADRLLDQVIGEYVLRASGNLRMSDVTGTLVLDVDRAPHWLLRRPVDLICHQAGNAVLDAFRIAEVKAAGSQGDSVDLDALYAMEQAVLDQLGLGISDAFSADRDRLMERSMRAVQEAVIDLRESLNAKPYEFPELEFPEVPERKAS